ncbi:MAG TPA: cobyric acid synthase, partial [Pseudolysinimonas sp.]|nr:cobyric acid synthase [Pseudolysinimonas sp.]
MITIVHLYPRELGINGDVGNVTALARRAGWRGLDLNVIGVGAGDTLPPQAHLVHIGSGPASAR